MTQEAVLIEDGRRVHVKVSPALLLFRGLVALGAVAAMATPWLVTRISDSHNDERYPRRQEVEARWVEHERQDAERTVNAERIGELKAKEVYRRLDEQDRKLSEISSDLKTLLRQQ